MYANSLSFVKSHFFTRLAFSLGDIMIFLLLFYQHLSLYILCLWWYIHTENSLEINLIRLRVFPSISCTKDKFIEINSTFACTSSLLLFAVVWWSLNYFLKYLIRSTREQIPRRPTATTIQFVIKLYKNFDSYVTLCLYMPRSGVVICQSGMRWHQRAWENLARERKWGSWLDFLAKRISVIKRYRKFI